MGKVENPRAQKGGPIDNPGMLKHAPAEGVPFPEIVGEHEGLNRRMGSGRLADQSFPRDGARLLP